MFKHLSFLIKDQKDSLFYLKLTSLVGGDMKNLIGLYFLLFMTSFAYAQTAPESIANVQVRYRNMDDANVLPVSVDSATYGDSQVEVEISFLVSNPDSMDVLVIKTGRKELSSDMMSAALVFTKEEDKNYFTYNDNKYEMINNTVVFTALVPESTLRKSSYVSLEVTDRKNRKSTTFTKKVN